MSARRLLASFGTVSLASLLLISARSATARLESAVANDNRTPAGTMVGDTLVLRLSVTPAQWHILGESQRAVDVLAFAEEGKPPMIPAPLIRARIGTPIRVELRNPLADTLVVRGLGERGGVRDSVVLLPGEAKEVRFVARHAGTYAYWGNTVADQRRVPVPARSAGLIHNRREAALGGALIVDSAGAVPADRIFVINEFVDRGAAGAFDHHGTPTREFTTLNGRSWPNTERLHVRVRRHRSLAHRERIVPGAPDAPPRLLLPRRFARDARRRPSTRSTRPSSDAWRSQSRSGLARPCRSCGRPTGPAGGSSTAT